MADRYVPTDDAVRELGSGTGPLDPPPGASLTVLGGEGSCTWVLTSPKFVEIERDLARQGR